MTPPTTSTNDTDRDERLLASMLDERVDLRELAQLHFDEPQSLLELANWINDEPRANSISGLKHLAEHRSDLNLARAQNSAVGLLLEIANGDDNATDLSRKACNDLLRAPRHAKTLRERAAPAARLAPADPADIREMQEAMRSVLEQVGAQTEPKARPSNGTSIAPSDKVRIK